MVRLIRSVCLLVALAFPVAGISVGHAASAVDELRQGPKVGMAIPHNLKVPDQNKQERDFKSLARKRGLIILFSRSLDW
jgi:hypothetical protein